MARLAVCRLQRIVPGGLAPSLMHRRWLAGLRLERVAHHLVLEDLIATVEPATERHDQLVRQIEALLPEWPLAPRAEAFCCLPLETANMGVGGP